MLALCQVNCPISAHSTHSPPPSKHHLPDLPSPRAECFPPGERRWLLGTYLASLGGGPEGAATNTVKRSSEGDQLSEFASESATLTLSQIPHLGR